MIIAFCTVTVDKRTGNRLRQGYADGRNGKGCRHLPAIPTERLLHRDKEDPESDHDHRTKMQRQARRCSEHNLPAGVDALVAYVCHLRLSWETVASISDQGARSSWPPKKSGSSIISLRGA
jgi:hypothetical protein